MYRSFIQKKGQERSKTTLSIYLGELCIIVRFITILVSGHA